MRLFDVDEIPDTRAEVQALFDLWASIYRKNLSRVKLNDKRKAKIARALADYGFEACQQAIRGCQYSDFHMGDNKDGTVYDDLELILRGPKQIEKFMRLAQEHEEDVS